MANESFNSEGQMQSIDLDMNASDLSTSLHSGSHNDFSLENIKASTIIKRDHSQVRTSISSTPIADMDTPEQSSKKLSIVLSKEMHRLAKMQALKEDVTLKDLVVRLIQDHLRNA